MGCGLCGSDIVKLKHKISKNGDVLGHEIVAVIEEIDSETPFLVNDKIIASHHIPCFECTYCKHGNYSMCSHFKETNIYPGGFSEKVYLTEEHLKYTTHKVPKNVSDEVISYSEPLACCLRAVKRSALKEGDRVLVVGLGSIGLLMAEALQHYGYKVFGCDLISERIRFAREKGIESYDAKNQDVLSGILSRQTNQEGVDAVFMTSGADKAVDMAVKMVRSGGKIIVFSSTPNNFAYTNNDIYYKELTVMGCYSSSPEDLKEAFQLLVNKKIDVENIAKTYALSEINIAIEDTVNNQIMKAYINISRGQPLEESVGDVFDICNSKMYLPDKDKDMIQHQTFVGKVYWDHGIMEMLKQYLPENPVVIDCGANIGSHTIYWAVEQNAKKVYAFEPLDHSFDILSVNVKLNNLSDRVELYNIGLSDEACKAGILCFSPNNIGGTNFRKDENGTTKMLPLDSLNIEEKVDLIKIDVENHEMFLLKGAEQTIAKNKPVILIETFWNKEEIDEFLGKHGYKEGVSVSRCCDYLYLQKDE